MGRIIQPEAAWDRILEDLRCGRLRGFRSILRRLPAVHAASLRGIERLVPWKDPRLFSAVWQAPVSGRPAMASFQFAVLAVTKDGFARRVKRALDCHLADEVMKAGGRLPFAFFVWKGQLLEEWKADRLWQWSEAGIVDAMVDRYDAWQGPTRWSELPKEIKGARVTCERCGQKVFVHVLASHQRRPPCFQMWVNRRGYVRIGFMTEPELARHPAWELLRRVGVFVELVELDEPDLPVIVEVVTIPEDQRKIEAVVRPAMVDADLELRPSFFQFSEALLDRMVWMLRQVDEQTLSIASVLDS